MTTLAIREPAAKRKRAKSPGAMVYQFGAKPPDTNGDLVAQQIKLARIYKNRLIELERARREAVSEAVRVRFPEMAVHEAAVEGIETELEAASKAASAANAAARSRQAAKAHTASIQAIRKRLKAARAARKAFRAGVWADEQLKAALAQIDADDLAARKASRADCGVYWGTYLLVEDSMKTARKGPPPVFRRWDGSGSVGVQIQHGMTVDELTSGTDSRVRLAGEGRHRVLWLRVGSDEDRRTIWAAAPITFHRDLPAGGITKRVNLRRRKIGTQMEWVGQLIVQGGTQPDRGLATSGTVAMDLGWRRVESGLRVCYWVGDDGGKGEIILPEAELSRWTNAESVQSIRDTNFNAARDRFADWLDTLADKPEWLAERAKLVRLWRSAERLGSLWWFWKDNRFDGDVEMFAAVQAWRKQDRHLWNWFASERVKAARWRDDLYRREILQLAQRYATCIVENVNWRELREEKPVEIETRVGRRIVRAGHVAAVGRLPLYAGQRMRLLKVSAIDSTRECHACGNIEAFDAANLHHACSKCHAVWDQDENAAINLLRRGLASGGAVKEDTGTARGDGSD